jgi:hypothetical protein
LPRGGARAGRKWGRVPMDEGRIDHLARVLAVPAAPGKRRGLLRVLAALPVAGAIAALVAVEEPAQADGSGAGVGGGGGRRHRRQARHHHHPGKDKQNRKGKRKGKGMGKGATQCPVCRSGESCVNGVCTCGSGPGCTGAGEICLSGICHNPYGCTAAMDFCQTDPQMPTFTPCPGNANGVCLTAAEGQFCVVVGNPDEDPNVSECAPGNDCANCPAGSDCVTVLGGVCTCPDGGTKGCAVPPPPP